MRAVRCFASIAALAGAAMGLGARADDLPGTSIASCVGEATMALAAADRRAELDAADSAAAARAIAARYPVIANDGLLPERLLLVRRGGAWIYVALRTAADKPGGACFTATFTATRFEFTPALVRKYFGVDA